MDPWEAEPRTAVREPKLPGGAGEACIREAMAIERKPGRPNRWSADRAPKLPWQAGRLLLVVRGVEHSHSLGV